MGNIGKLGRALLFVIIAAFGAGTLVVSEDAAAAPQGHHAKAKKHKRAHRKPAKRVAHKKAKAGKHAKQHRRAAHQHPIGS